MGEAIIGSTLQFNLSLAQDGAARTEIFTVLKATHAIVLHA